MKKLNSFISKYRPCNGAVRLLLLIIVGLFSSSTSYSQSMKEVWKNMPDSLFAYLNSSLREECVELSDKGLTAEVTNLLNEKTTIDTLSADYMNVSMSKSTTMQMRLMPRAEGDSIVCVVVSYKVPETDSNVSFYTKDWKKISDLSFDIKNFVQRPDTMTVDRYKDIINLLDPYIMSARLSATDNSLLVSVSAAIASKEDEEQLSSVLINRRYEWNGSEFVLQ